MTEPGVHGPSAPSSTMPALLERPKLSNAMARALHRHIMMERERKRQGELGPEREDARPGARCSPGADPDLRADPARRPQLEEGPIAPTWRASEARSKLQNRELARTLEST